jgi:cobalt-zinc-cadmium efflux system membrane fusion protein
VRRGTPLAVIESAIVGADQSKLLAARAHVEVAAAEYGRTQDLVAKGIVPAKDLLLAQQELEAAKAEQQATIQALHVVGAEGEAGSYTLTAPLGGVVSRRNIGLGTLVDVEDMLFEIVDPSSMWAEIDVREADLAVVRVGQEVVLTVDGLGEREFRGRIASIAPAIDPRTRTTTARARLANPDGALRANMYGRARIAIGESRTSVAVPPGAVQRARGIPLVFVRLADDLYETRRVRLGPTSGDLVVVAEGVHPGERVVTVGSFLLKTETLKESIGAGCCEIEPKK